METIPITVNGAKFLEDELLKLKDEVRPRIVNDIATAREHGDLKENAEYHAAKEEQAFVEGRIQEIESCLLYTSPSPRDRSLSRMPSSA